MIEKEYLEIFEQIEKGDEEGLVAKIEAKDKALLDFLKIFAELGSTKGWQVLQFYIERRADINSLLGVPDEKLPIERARIRGMLEIVHLVNNYKRIYELLRKRLEQDEQ